MNLARFTQPLRDLDTMQFFRDMENFATGTDGLTSLAADAGATVAAGSTRTGVAILTTGAVNNNEAGLWSTNALFTALAGKPMYARGSLQYAEAATNAANVFFGFASSPGANLLVDDGAGPRTTGTICGIYKVDGGTVWRCVTRNGSTVTDTISTTTAGGTPAQVLEVMLGDWDGVNMQVSFKVDGVYLKDSSGNKITHQLPISGATIAGIAAYVKDGSGTGEVLNVDYLYAHQLR